MSKQDISLGSVANDGTGDTLRVAGSKINANFNEIYSAFGSGTALSTDITITDNAIIFEGTPNTSETFVRAVDPTSDRNIYLPDADGFLVTDSSTTTLLNKTLFAPALNNPVLHDASFWDADSSHQYSLVAGGLTGNVNITLPNLTDNDTFAMLDHAQTMTNKTLYRPIAQQSLNDSLNNLILEFDRLGTASYIAISNADDPSIHVHSSNANANLDLEGKGTGVVSFDKMRLKSDGEITTTGNSISTQSGFVIFEKAGTPNAQTLADGNHTGEMRVFVNKGAADVTLTITTGAGVSSVTIPQHKGLQCIWDNDGAGGADKAWYVISNNGCTLTP